MPHAQFNSCIEACHACAVACNHCASSCLQEQDVTPMARCIALDLDCAEICTLAASLMSRGSDQSQAVCALCADACQACADECRKHPMDHCRQCAEACTRCADECRRMVTPGWSGYLRGS